MRNVHWIAVAALLLAFAASPASAQSYRYDALGRLIDVIRDGSRTIYSYDPADNRSNVTTAQTTFVGTAGADYIVGTGYDDQISGLGGDDFIVGGGGVDAIDGGAGLDTSAYPSGTVAFSFVSNGVVTASPSTGGTQTLTGVELAYIPEFSGTYGGGTYPIAYLLTPNATFEGTNASDPPVNGNTTGVDRINGYGGDDIFAHYGGVDVVDGGDGWDNEFFGGALGDYDLRWVSLGSSPHAALLVTYKYSNEWVLLISVEGMYFDGSSDWVLTSSVP